MSHPATPSARIRVALLAGAAVALLAAGFALRARDTLAPLFGSDPSARTHLLELGVFLVVGAFVTAIAVALTASSLAVTPINELTRVANVMRRDLGMRSGLRGADEVGQLGEALDNLAAWVATEKHSLEEDRDRLVAILESMREGVLVTGDESGHEGVIVMANAALREMLLVDRSILGRSPLEVIRVAGLDDLLARATQSTEGAVEEIELGGIRPRRLLAHASPLRSQRGGEAHGLVVVFNDVTELRRLESMRRDFVANVSHELRTPITAIRAAAETLEGGALGDANAAKDFVGIVARNAKRLQDLVEDLLDLSRIEARQWQLQLEPVVLREAASAAMDVVAAAASERKSIVTNAIAGDLVVHADRRALEQVLVNLLDNAVKYAGQSAHVEIGAKHEDGRVVLHVKDDGPGIDARHQPRIFERFYRVDAGRSRAVGGTGLGLSIVKHLVEAMKGEVEVKSRSGEGTTFLVQIPDAAPAQ